MTTNPKKESRLNAESTPADQENTDALDAAKKIENTQRQHNPANAQDKNANQSQDIEGKIKRGEKPADIEG